MRNAAIPFTLSRMGAWGYKPLQNDGALDELGRIFEECQLADRVSESLQQDVHENVDEIRATAYLVYILAKHGLWQDGRLAEITALAISRLRIILDEGVYENVSFHGETIHLVNQLREIEPNPGNNFKFPPTEL